MKLSIESLNKSGSFSGAPVEREIEWKQGDETLKATVFVRRLSYQSAVSDVMSASSKKDALAGRIAACIVDEKGEQIFTREDITGEADPTRGPLDYNLTLALLNAIGEVQSLGKSPTSQTSKKSGTS